MSDHSPLTRSHSHKDLSPAGQAMFAWLRQLARALRVARLYRSDNPVVQQSRETVRNGLTEMLKNFGTLTLRFTAREIRLETETVVRPYIPPPGHDAPPPNPEDTLPFLFYRDGIRALQLCEGIPREDFDAFFDAVRMVGQEASSHDDLLTLMWQANLTYIRVEAVPLEQTIYLSSRRPGSRDKDDMEFNALAFSWAPTGTEIHAELGQVEGAQGLHKDTFDDWELPYQGEDAREAFQHLLPDVELARSFLMATWAEERDRDWTVEAEETLRHIVTEDPSDDTRAIAARSAMTWVLSAIHRTDWVEATRALTLLKEFDPELRFVRDELNAKIKELPLHEIAEQLDETGDEEQARFAAIMVALGPCSVDLAITVMSFCARSRPRAAACTALCYTCSDDPMLLAGAINDPRWYVVRNAVFILGQIGGPGVIDLLLIAARHPEPRVRRQVVQALGGVPAEKRVPILLSQLDTRDQQLLSATLNMLSRDRHPRALKALLERFAAPNFEYAPEWVLRSYMHTLQDWVDNTSVPLLAGLLERGGWMAAASPVRTASARLLNRINTEASAAALEHGLRSRHQPIRDACMQALGGKKAA